MVQARHEDEDEDQWLRDMPWDDEEEAGAPQRADQGADHGADAAALSDTELLTKAQQTIDELLGYVAEMEAQVAGKQQEVRELRAVIPDLRGQLARLGRERKDMLGELDEHRRSLSALEREHEKCAGVKLMLERQIGRLEDQLRACQEGRLPACVQGKETGEMVPVDEGALKVLGKQAAQTEHMRQRYHYMAAAETDDRFKPGQKATMAALVDICGAPPGGEGFTAPRKVCRAAIAQRTGQAASTISKQVPDLANIGVLKLERRAVTKERPSDDPDGSPLRRTEEEWWVSLGPLPPKSVPKEEIQAKCTHAHAEAERKKRCPGCGHTTLEATAYHCTSCGRTCATAEAQAAGERFAEHEDGAIVDLLTGEKLAPLFVPTQNTGNGHARTGPRRRHTPHPDSGGGARHTTIVHPHRNPDGVSSNGTGTIDPHRIPDGATSGTAHGQNGWGHTTASPIRNPDGGHATTPPCTPTGIRMGSAPHPEQGGTTGHAASGSSPPS